MKPYASNTAPGALEILERGAALLREAPLRAWAAYALGTLPFALALLYFWAEMSHGAFARRHCLPQSLALASLFGWMKCWQALFGLSLRDQLTGATPARWTLTRAGKLMAVQAATQPWGLFLLPLGMVILAPFGWLFAFFQNLTVLGEERGEIQATVKKAGRLAALWPSQNHMLLLLLAIFGVFVWLNIMSAIYLVPVLLKMLLGIETVFTMGGVSAYLNSTTLTASLILTYLCLDPLTKAAYLVRCFHGTSLASGEDLKVELQDFRLTARTWALVLLLVGALTAAGVEPTARSETPTVLSDNLNQSIERVLARDEFTWRMPRAPSEKDPKLGWFARFVEDSRLAIREFGKWFRSVANTIRDWWRKLWPESARDQSAEETGSSVDWSQIVRLLVAILIIAICCLIAILVMRTWRQRRKGEDVMVEATAVLPDLEDENVVASHLPEEEWLKLAQELMKKGDLRLALRAYYLSSLAHLADREMVAIAKFKSNRDYDLELRWRRRTLTELHQAFSENVALFERVWYGMHEVTQDALGRFQSNVQRIRSC